MWPAQYQLQGITLQQQSPVACYRFGCLGPPSEPSNMILQTVYSQLKRPEENLVVDTNDLFCTNLLIRFTLLLYIDRSAAKIGKNEWCRTDLYIATAIAVS